MNSENKITTKILLLFLGVLIGIIITSFFYENMLFNKNIKKIEDGKVLIICDDKSTNWYDMPTCKKGDEKNGEEKETRSTD